MGEEIQLQIELADIQHKEMDKELGVFAAKIQRFEMQLDDKIELPILQPIWKNFERFALYDDLKDLYSKVLPEIVKFEQRIINF